ncbi:tetraspanin-9-like isoform X2 [Pecten maximus]|uniref:tetraspanin-9-like isoform X2 n=1 Tax=Pecten maximus TaxID=6579 RepID=UPI001458A2C8|nr:tetraspanin-9-like isoform X2 [Pecten maximus]
MGLSCSGKVGMLFLIIINIIFMLLGLGLLIPGILVQVNVDIVNDKVMPLLNQLSLGGLTFGNAANGLSVTLIILGAFILLVAALGAFGACCKNRCMLVVYAIIVAVFWIAQIVIVILWFVMRGKLESEAKAQLLSQLQNNYKHDDLTSHELSTAWNYLSIELKCCGVDAVTSATNDYDGSVWQAGTPTAQIPKACCGATVSDYTTYSNAACTDTVTSGYYATGCYQAVYDKVMTYSNWFIGVGITLLVIEIICMGSVIMLVKESGRTGIMV